MKIRSYETAHFGSYFMRAFNMALRAAGVRTEAEREEIYDKVFVRVFYFAPSTGRMLDLYDAVELTSAVVLKGRIREGRNLVVAHARETRGGFMKWIPRKLPRKART